MRKSPVRVLIELNQYIQVAQFSERCVISHINNEDLFISMTSVFQFVTAAATC